MKRWLKFEGLGRRLVVAGLVLALTSGISVSLISSSSTASLAISAAGYTTHYGPPPCKSGKSHDYGNSRDHHQRPARGKGKGKGKGTW